MLKPSTSKVKKIQLILLNETEYLRLITANIHVVEERIQQLLDLSKIESPSLKLDKQPFIFSEIVQEFVYPAGLTASEKGLIINCINCEDLSWISADIHMMERVIQNLLGNAIKFTSENGKILIDLEKQNEHLIFRITNQGEQLSDKLLEWLNDGKPVSSGNRPATRGLGLIIVKTILQLNEFPLSVEYKQEAGNIFSFRMPLTNPSAS